MECIQAAEFTYRPRITGTEPQCIITTENKSGRLQQRPVVTGRLSNFVDTINRVLRSEHVRRKTLAKIVNRFRLFKPTKCWSHPYGTLGFVSGVGLIGPLGRGVVVGADTPELAL